jgi:uncharacterized protein (TIGR02145 family)
MERGGDLKISQDGTKLVCSDSLTEICDFNATTGVVTPKFIINISTVTGAEFSVDSKYLYLIQNNNSGWQFDLSYEDSASFVQHKILIGDGVWSHLQLALNWKIYTPTGPDVDSLNCINNPSLSGLACNFQKNAVSLAGNGSNQCLIQFLQTYKVYIHFTGICPLDTTYFTPDVWPPPDSLHWNFGDPASGISNFSTLVNPSHVYSTPGTYTVTLFVKHIDNRTDTAWMEVTIDQAYQPSLGPDRTICIGDSVTFNAGACSGCSYQWTDLVTDLPVGNEQIFTTGLAGIYQVAVTDTNSCIGRDTVQLTTIPQPSITNNPLSKTICSGDSTNIVLASNEPGSNFIWTATLTFGNITGFSADSGIVINQILTNNGASQGIVTYHITPKAGSCSGTTVDFPVTVNAGAPVNVGITASNNGICTGTTVTFTATPTNGGTLPSYQWIINGINVGTNNPNYTYLPINGDIVKCILTSNVLCSSNNPATSNTITMIVNSYLPVNVSISGSANSVCAGISVTFTATPTNGGLAPDYQWKVNGVNVGINSSTYQYIPSNGDSVSCILTSSLPCTTGNPFTSNTITMNIFALPVVTFTACFDTTTTTTAQPFKLKGGIPPGGIYSGPGVNSLTGIFTPSLAGTGTKTITYTYTNAAMCSRSKSIHIIVQAAPSFICGNNFTDIRDNKVYPTVQIGSQCWLASNLNYGTIIASTQDQRDNCISEKYCYNDDPVNCTNQGGLYQWDELMLYDDTPGDQGFCPPDWHIPTENDWNTLFANWINNGFAGSPLKYSGYSGFNALLSGARHIDKSWDFKGFATFFWSSTSYGGYKAWAHGMNNPDPSVSVYPSSRVNAFSVRCVKD